MRNHFANWILNPVRWKRNRYMKRAVILRHADVVDVGGWLRVALRRGVGERAGNLSGAVRPEIEKDDGVGVLHFADGLSGEVDDHRRLDELVRLLGDVTRLNS